MKKSIALLVAVGALLAAGSAQAQDRFGSRGQMAFSADRLFGFYGYSATTNWNEPNQGEYEYKQSGTQMGLLWGASSAENIGINPYVVPRLSFDYFVIDGLSIGGSLGFAKTSGELKQEKGPGNLDPTVDLDTQTMWAIAPRVGYAYMFNDIIGIWPRGGFTYASLGSEADNGDENNYHVFSLDLEAMFVIVPKEHFAFVVGPVIDFGLTGGYEHKDQNPPAVRPGAWDADVKLHTYGLAAGMLGYF